MSSLRRLLDAGEDEEQDEMKEDEAIIQMRRRSKTSRLVSMFLSTIMLMLLFTLLGLGTVWMYRNRSLLSSGDAVQFRSRPSCNCGNSANEAIANGCRFDPYSATWLPDDCWDDELFKMFESLKIQQRHDFSLYSWSKPPQRLSIEEVGLIAGDPWNITDNRIRTSQSWHYAHCVYVLLKHFRSDATNTGMAARYMSQEHAEHCATTLMQFIATDPEAHAVSGVSAVYVFNDPT